MLAVQPQWRARIAGALIVCAATAALTAPASASRVPAGPESGLVPMTFGGYRFELPRSWPVIQLSGHQHTCVRFDRRAVYVGTPGRDQSCPARIVGTTEALLIQRGPARAARSAVEDQAARQITATAPGISVTATLGTHPRQMYQILRSASLPEPVVKAPRVSRLTAARLPARVTNYHGLGFDACTAPSAAYMRAWRRHSPYRAVGIYIGGSDRACAQPNLTRAWLRRETDAGWHFMPMYVGPQADYGELSSPAQQGAAAGTDAVAQAEMLGFGPGTPLYYDMEAYPARQSTAALSFLSAWTVTIHQLGYSSGVYSSSGSAIEGLAKQYFTGAYAMPDVIYDALWNGSADTVDPVFQPGEWPGRRRLHQFNGNTTQTFGGDTINVDQDYLDVRMRSLGSEGTPEASPSVRGSGGIVDAFFRGAGDRLWQARYRPGAGWAAPVDLGGSDKSGPTAVRPGGAGSMCSIRAQTVTCGRPPTGRAGDGSKCDCAGWAALVARPARSLSLMASSTCSGRDQPIVSSGTPGSRQAVAGAVRSGSAAASPRARLPCSRCPAGSRSSGKVRIGDCGTWPARAQPGAGRPGWEQGRSAVSLRRHPSLTALSMCSGGEPGRPDLWLAAASPDGRWSAPQDLGGRVRLAPFPVAPASGLIRVFWRGRDGRLWLTVHRPRTGWLAPIRLPMGRLGSGPVVTVGGDPTKADVFWRGRGGALWSASLQSGGTWAGPLRIGG